MASLDVPVAELAARHRGSRGQAPLTPIAPDGALSLAASGEDIGFRSLFMHYKGIVLKHICGIASIDADSAEDIQQEVFIRAFRSLTTLRDVRAFEFWLYQITRRETLRFLKRRRHHLGLEACGHLPSEREESLAEAHEKDRRLALLHEFGSSTSDDEVQRTAALYYLSASRVSAEAIAVQLGVSPGTVRKRLYAYRKRLRATLRRELAEYE